MEVILGVAAAAAMDDKSECCQFCGSSKVNARVVYIAGTHPMQVVLLPDHLCLGWCSLASCVCCCSCDSLSCAQRCVTRMHG